MIGIIVGVVSSILIFAFYSKDEKAVKLYKQKKVKQQKQRIEQKKRQQEQLQKIRNDPVVKKQRQQQQKAFQENFMKKIDDKDKKIIAQYLQKNKKDGKTDQQLIKEASNQANLFMGVMLMVIVTFVFAMLVLNGVEVQTLKNGVLKFLGEFFPKIKEATANTSTDL